MKPPTGCSDQRGIILPSVLIILALASAVVMMMITLQDIAIQRSRRFNEAAQANAYIRGGELSVAVALRRDGVDAAQTDNLTEGWASISDAAVKIENGEFTLSVLDAQAKFNLNNLATTDLTGLKTLETIARALKMAPSTPARIADFLRIHGPLRQMEDLESSGLSALDIARLGQMAVALPVKTQININTADEALIAAVLDNAPIARQLVLQRKRKGFLTSADISAARAILPPGIGFTSNFFEVSLAVTIGDTSQFASTLLQRSNKNQIVDVFAIRRTHGKAAPSLAPPSQ